MPSLPPVVDPSAWLRHEPQQVFRRRADASGHIKIDLKRYYIGKAWRGQPITIHLNAEQRQLILFAGEQKIKTLSVSAWSSDPVPLTGYVQQMQEQAKAEARLRSRQERQQRIRALSVS